MHDVLIIPQFNQHPSFVSQQLQLWYSLAIVIITCETCVRTPCSWLHIVFEPATNFILEELDMLNNVSLIALNLASICALFSSTLPSFRLTSICTQSHTTTTSLFLRGI